MFKKLRKAFTLVELLVVIGVIGVLAAGLVAVINPADRVAAANDAKVLADMNQLASALKAYSATNGGSYPSVAASAVGGASSFATVVAAVPNELSVTSIPGAQNYLYGHLCTASACKLSVTQRSRGNLAGALGAYVCWTSTAGITRGTGTVAATTPTGNATCP